MGASESDNHDFLSAQRSDMNREIMLVSAASLSLVMLLIVSFYIYVRCVLVTRQSRHRRQRLTFTLHLHHTHSDELPTIGLDPALIAALPVFNVRVDGGSNVTECVVCLSTLEDGEMAKLLPNCKHVFHVGCIDTWLASHSTCPLCRARVQPPLQPHLREGPSARPLDAEPLVIQVLPRWETWNPHMLSSV